MGPNLRKLIYASGLVAAGGAVSVIPGGGIAASVIANLLGGVGGNFAHQLFDDLDHQGFDTVASRALGIDENHHILLQLRRSHIKALRQLATDFQSEVVDLPDRTFLKVLNQFLDQAECPARLLPQSEVTEEEKAVFAQLPDALRASLSARNSEAGAATLANADQAKAELFRLAFDELAVEIGGYCPPSFLSLASREEGGFVDLFVRDAAGALRENTAFRAIWSAEQQQHIRDDIRDLGRHIDERFDGVHDHIDTAKADVLVGVQDMLEQAGIAVAVRKHIPLERLRPILERLGRTNVPESDYERVLSEAVDQLLAQSRERVLPNNFGPEIDHAIEAARLKLANLDIDGARSVLNKAIAEQRDRRQAEQRAEASLLIEKARVEETSFDYVTATADLKAAIAIDGGALQAWQQLGHLYIKIGQSSLARETFEQLLLQAEHINDPVWISITLDRLGTVLRQQGNLSEALRVHQRGLVISEQLAREDKNPQARRNVAVGLSKIGRILHQKGNLREAQQTLKRALAIREELARSVGDAQSQSDLSQSQYEIGDIFRQQGNLTTALAHYQLGLDIDEGLGTDRNDAESQLATSIGLERIGEVLFQQNNFSEALRIYRRILVIRELLASDKKNAQAQRNLTISLNKYGDIFRQLGDLSSALQIYERSLSICEHLALDKYDAEAQRGLMIGLSKVGNILRELGDLDDAIRNYQRALIISERLAHDKNDAQAQRDLTISLNRVGDIYIQQGNLQGALELYTRGLTISEQLAQDQNDAQAQLGLAIRLERMGDVFHLQGNMPEALQAYNRSLTISERLAHDENDAFTQRGLGVAYGKVASVINTPESWQLVLNHFLTMKARGQLSAKDEQHIIDIRAHLQRLQDSSNEPT
jgi:tetratricopeptide (TPR) repeat protein